MALTPAAAACRYSVQGFMDKNRDALFQDFKRLLYNRWVARGAGWQGPQQLRREPPHGQEAYEWPSWGGGRPP